METKSENVLNDSNNKLNKHSIFKYIFLISLLNYAFWLFISIHFYIFGFNPNLFMMDISYAQTVYGFEAYISGLTFGFLFTLTRLWFIPLYQIIYVIVIIIKSIKKQFLKFLKK